jgi:hypothetical protein
LNTIVLHIRAFKIRTLFFLKILVLLIFLVFTENEVKSQQSSTMFFMHDLPQSNYLNPAVQIPCKIFIGIPLLSSIYAGYSNSYFSYSDVLTQTKNSGFNVNIKKFIEANGSIENIFTEVQVSLINFGFRYKSYYFNFDLSDKVDVGVNYPTNAFNLMLLGNTRNVGSTSEIGGLAVFGNYYREWAFGVSKKINDQFTFGGKFKMLFGKANVETDISDLNVTTSNAPYPISLKTKFTVNTTPFNIALDAFGVPNSATLNDSYTTLFLNSQNKGAAIDFGTIYKYSNEITFSASFLDLGFIFYKYKPTNIIENSTFDFAGLTYKVTKTFNTRQQIIDSLRSSYRVSLTNEAYFTETSPKLYIGGTYQILPYLNLGLMSRNQLYNSKLVNSVTFSVNSVYKKYIQASGSWTYANGTILNLGAGIALRTPTIGFYLISDNIYGACWYKSARLLNARLGFNLLFGCSSSSNSKMLLKSGCAIYRESESKKSSFMMWKEKLLKEKNSRK